MDLKARAKALAETEKELRQETASSLRRVAEMLEEHIAAMRELRARFDAAGAEERIAIAAAHDERLALAQERLWVLCVQREAMGLRRHEEVYVHYPLPERLGKRRE